MVLIEMFKNRWKELSGGKPIVATINIYESVSKAQLMEIWNGFCQLEKTGVSEAHRGGAAFFNEGHRDGRMGNRRCCLLHHHVSDGLLIVPPVRPGDAAQSRAGAGAGSAEDAHTRP